MNSKKIPQGEKGREEEINALIEDQTLILFQLALARRRLELILENGLMQDVYEHMPDLVRVQNVLSRAAEYVKENKTWLLGERGRPVEADPVRVLDESSSGPERRTDS